LRSRSAGDTGADQVATQRRCVFSILLLILIIIVVLALLGFFGARGRRA
jgi:hypothetical protein